MIIPATPRLVRIPARAAILESCVSGVRMREFYISPHKVTVGEYRAYLSTETRMKGLVGIDKMGRVGLLARSADGVKDEWIPCHHDPLAFHERSAWERRFRSPVSLAPLTNSLVLPRRLFENPSHPMVGVNIFQALGYIDWRNRQGPESARHGLYRLPYASETEVAALGLAGRNRYGTSTGKLFTEKGKKLAHFNPELNHSGLYTVPVGTYPGVQWEDGVIFDLAGNGCEFQGGLFAGARTLAFPGQDLNHPVGAKPLPAMFDFEQRQEVRVGIYHLDTDAKSLQARHGLPVNAFYFNRYSAFRLAADPLPK